MRIGSQAAVLFPSALSTHVPLLHSGYGAEAANRLIDSLASYDGANGKSTRTRYTFMVVSRIHTCCLCCGLDQRFSFFYHVTVDTNTFLLIL